MTPKKLRILVSGLLALCLLSLVWPDGFSLSTLVALCGAWACSVWLWNGEKPSITFSAMLPWLNAVAAKALFVVLCLVFVLSIWFLYSILDDSQPSIVAAPAVYFVILFGLGAGGHVVASYQKKTAKKRLVERVSRQMEATAIREDVMNRAARALRPDLTIATWRDLPADEIEALYIAAMKSASDARAKALESETPS